MDVDEFLKSAHAARRTKISAFDTEIRALRAQGISGQGIVNFLKLHNVLVTVSAVNQYFVRHPIRYSVRRGVPATKMRDDNGTRHAGGSPDGTGPEQQPIATGVLTAAAGTNAAAVANAGAALPRASDDAVRGPDSPSTTGNHASLTKHRDSNATPDALHGNVTDSTTTSPKVLGGPAVTPRSDSPRNARPNAAPIRDAFDSRPNSDETYDGQDTNRPSPLKRYDPNDPKNIAAVVSYKQRLRDGQIRTGETTNTNLDRSTDET